MEKITHIYHDGFALELDQTVLIFDWYRGELPRLPKGKKTVILASHSHQDHYHRQIFDLRGLFEDLSYVLDSGIVVPEAEEGCDIRKISPGQEILLPGEPEIRVRAFFSTDIGSAFLVEAEGKLIFHAGDLNIWYWEGEPEEENLWQEKTYLEEIRKIKEAVGDRVIDLAFLPLDVRLESHAPDGFLAFLSEIPLKLAVPMHYWGEEQKMRACLDLKEMAAYADRIKVF